MEISFGFYVKDISFVRIKRDSVETWNIYESVFLENFTILVKYQKKKTHQKTPITDIEIYIKFEIMNNVF